MIYLINSVKFLNNYAKHYLSLHARLLSGLNLWHEDISSEIKLKIEDHWRDKLKTPIYDDNGKPEDKYFVCAMFPYPSGFLHMGHVRVYTISDVIARFQRLNGKNVIHPIGWDAFGLPAENAAIERQIAPKDWTDGNIKHMRSQFQTLGCSFEWHRELASCDPKFYRWTQELLLKLYDAGLLYQKKAMVNWDPIDQTVLADEQVDENGYSWRSGAKVEQKAFTQWFVKTTAFAKDLYDGLDDKMLQDWRDIIKLQQHWIGECTGVNFDFKLINYHENDFIRVWTDIPEYIENAEFICINDKHILADCEGENITPNVKQLKICAKNVFNNRQIPIFVTNSIEYLPFTDIFLGIPGVCEKSKEFANLINLQFDEVKKKLPEEEIKAKQLEVCKKAKDFKVGGDWSSAKLRDWLISRQRFWGTPIPIIHCDSCGTIPVPREDLPVELPNLTKVSRKGTSSLNEFNEWINVPCPKCNKPAKRETDTMDTFVDSSWYYLRYLDNQYMGDMFDVKKAKTMVPVDLYIGGKEHAVLHLYYARFVSHFLYSLGMVPQREPFKRLLVQGLVMGRSYRVKETGEYVPESTVTIIDAKKNKAVTKDGKPVVMCWEKMSKSKHNGVDPDDMFKEYGVDTTRLLILADVAPTSHRNWNSSTFPGVLSWQNRLWLTIRDFIKHRTNPPPAIPKDKFKVHDDYMFDSRNYYVKGATFNYCGSQQHSVALSKQQGLTNSIRKVPPAVFASSLQFERALASQIIILAPMAPHFAAELWSGFVSAPNRLNNTGEIDWDKTVLEQKWPKIDRHYNMELICKMNDEEVCAIKIPKCDIENLTEEEALNLALQQQSIQELLVGNSIKRAVYIAQHDYDSIINIKTEFVQKKEKKDKKKIKKAVSTSN